MQPGGDSLAFLEAIYADALAKSPGYLLVWTAAGKRSAWFRDIEQASAYALRSAGDTYVGVGLSDRDYGPKQRAKADQIVAVPAFWLDIDVKGPVHKHDDLPPDFAGAERLISDVGLEPSVTIHTGHGLQAWWKVADGDCSTPELRESLHRTVLNWQQYQIHSAQARHSWRIDATHDLARLMRLPGTWNMKADPVLVSILSIGSASREEGHE